MNTAAASLAPAAVSGEPAASTRGGLVAVYAAYVLRYVYPLILIPFYGRVLGVASYGRVLAAMSLLQMVWMLVEYGFAVTGTRAAATSADRAGLAAIYGRHLVGRCAMLPLALAFGAAGTALSPVLSARPLVGALATLAGAVAAFNVGWFFQGTLRFRRSMLLELLGFPITLPLVLLFVRGPEDDWIVFAAQLLACSVGCGLGHLLVLRQVDRRALRFDGALALVRESSALFATRGMGLLMSNSATYLLSLFGSAVHVGWYGAAERLAGAALGLMLPAQQVLVSTICARLATKAETAAGYALMRKAIAVMSIGGVLLLVASSLMAATLVPLLLGPEFVPAVSILHVLAWMFPFAAMSQVVTACVLVPLRLDGLATRISVAGAALTVGAVLVLGWRFDGTGAAWGRVAGYVVMAVLTLAALRRRQLLSLLPRIARTRGRAEKRESSVQRSADR